MSAAVLSLSRLLALALVLLLSPAAWGAGLPPLIPREVLFGNPERDQPRLSPDGKHLAWLAPDERGVLQLWVRPVDDEGGARKLTDDRQRGIRWYFWAWDDRTLLYMQDQLGNEVWHLYGVDVPTGNVRDYTPFQGVTAGHVRSSARRPGELLVQLNLRRREVFDVYLLDLRTGALVLKEENPGDVGAWFADEQLVVRAARSVRPDGGTLLRWRTAPGAPWKTWREAGPGETLTLLGVARGGRSAVLLSSLGSETARVVEDSPAGRPRVLAEDARVDAREGDVLLHPVRDAVQAVAFDTGRKAWTLVDPALREDFEALARLSPGDFSVVSRDREDRRWVVSFIQDQAPRSFFLYERASRQGRLLFSTRPRLEGYTLAQTRSLTLPARDGLRLPAYLTLPPGVEPRGLPLVVLVHGGPWWRDVWGYDPEVQLLANRGYAVLQVNFRGSLGFGKSFLRAGARQWGRKMQDDLTDGVAWAVREGLADPARVAIQGASYGGYAALAGATFTPDVYRCAVSLAGISNLETLVRSFPAHAQIRGWWNERVGNVDDPADAELLRGASPVHAADRIRIPLLVGQGANDPRVTKAEAEQIVAATERNGKQGVYALYPDEGHGLARPENQLDFVARTEAFLAEHLGGRAEPMAGEKHPGSSVQLRVLPGRGGARAASGARAP
jgi:dipeptidyl aminopeptidase/acylaminoacyl peptidase